MQRLDATRVAVELAGEAPIIGGVGNSTFDLVPFDRPQHFYMWNSMGMASSIGLGLALARPDLRVIVLDGDGSILMNLGSLATERASGVTNLVHVIWDNGGWEITGAQPAGSPFGIDLETVARGCGFSRTATAQDLDSFRHVFAEAMADTQPWAIVGKVEPGDSAYRPSKNCIWLRDRFRTSLEPQGDGSS
jgi:thiamine pyrophosphate-dependent acetolactate synthase large subunit-like protein